MSCLERQPREQGGAPKEKEIHKKQAQARRGDLRENLLPVYGHGEQTHARLEPEIAIKTATYKAFLQ